MSQVIVTKLLPATNTKPKRISAQTTSGYRKSTAWESVLDASFKEANYNGQEYSQVIKMNEYERVHYHMARSFALSLGWNFTKMHSGDLNMRGDMVWIFE